MKILFLCYTNDPTSGGWGRYTFDLQKALTLRGLTCASLPQLAGRELPNPLSYFSNPLRILRDLLLVRKILRTYQPDVLHITVEPYLLLLPFLPLQNKKVVITVHGTYAYLPVVVPVLIKKFVRLLFVRAITRTDIIISISTYTKNYLIKKAHTEGVLIEETKVHVIHNGISTKDYCFIKATGNLRRRIISVAPSKERKGILEAIRALGAYKKYYDNFEYRIIGSVKFDSPYMKKVMQEVERQDLLHNVVWLGKVTDEQLRQEYTLADLYLMLPVVAHENQFEGFGLVYLEANACGVPVIGSRSGGVPEAIKEGVSGFSVEATDVSAITERIHVILEGGMINRAQARQWAVDNDIARVAERVACLYSR